MWGDNSSGIRVQMALPRMTAKCAPSLLGVPLRSGLSPSHEDDVPWRSCLHAQRLSLSPTAAVYPGSSYAGTHTGSQSSWLGPWRQRLPSLLSAAAGSPLHHHLSTPACLPILTAQNRPDWLSGFRFLGQDLASPSSCGLCRSCPG